jgi:hypothetical protein
MKTQKGHFVELPAGFSVSVPKHTAEHFVMKPSGLYITHSFASAWIHYAGEGSEDSLVAFEIPSDPSYLRKLGREFNKLAKKIESEREG